MQISLKQQESDQLLPRGGQLLGEWETGNF